MVARQMRVVVLQKGFVGQHDRVPTPYPFAVEGKEAGAFDAAAEIAVAGRGGRLVCKVLPIQLIDTGGAYVISSIKQALAEVALQQRTLPGGDHRRESRVVIRRQRPVVRD